MGKNTSISLGNHFESFISKKINSGRYNSVSEVIRSALRLLETEEQNEKAIINALIIGEKSEIIDNFNSVEHLQELHRNNL